MSITFFHNRLSFYILLVFCIALLIQLCIHWIRFAKIAFNKRGHRLKRDDELEPVSVVVCARDSYEQLSELIPLLLKQDYPQFEVVVVNDCSDDETEEYLKDLERCENRIKPVQLRQHLNFFNGKKFPLSMGIKSASYDLMVLTDADCKPTSEQWLRSMVSGYGDGTEVVISHNRYRQTGGLLNLMVRFEAVQTAMMYLSAALAGKPYRGVGKNLSYRQRLFFRNKGFTSHYAMAAGDDDVFISQTASKRNTQVVIDAENTIESDPPQNFGFWVRNRCNKYATITMLKPSARSFAALHYWSQFLFYGGFIALLILKPAFAFASGNPLYYFLTLAGCFLLRFITQMIVYRGVCKRLGESHLLPGLILLDFVFAILTPLFRITGRLS